MEMTGTTLQTSRQASDAENAGPIVEMSGISKSFGGETALEDVSISIGRGQILALCGANGAGKSTLVRILAGVETADHGSIRVAGEDVAINSPAAANALGLSFIHQELNLVPKFTALQNMALQYPGNARAGIFLDRRATRRRAAEVMERLGGHVPLDEEVARLSVADRWLVSLGRSLMSDARMIAMDEPTASFSEEESGRLFAIIEDLRSSGVGILYISHRLDEVLAVSDDIAVLRDGKLVATLQTERVQRGELTQEIVGRQFEEGFSPRARSTSDRPAVLALRGLTSETGVRGVDLDIRSGEILGVAGLVGSGRTELARLIFGVDSPTAGTMQLQGREYRPRSPYHAIRQGVAMLPEERRSQALLLADSVERNIRLATLKDDRVGRFGLISPRRARAAAAEMVRRLSIKTASLDQPVGALSGGNQQKVVASRYMLTEPTVLILDEPTVGVDVGARQELHTIIRELADAGSAVVMISSDFDEFAFCERVALMREGRVVEVLDGADATKEHLTTLCYAVPDEEHPDA